MSTEDGEAASESTPLLSTSRSNAGSRSSAEQDAPSAETLPSSLSRSAGLSTGSMKAGYAACTGLSGLMAAILLVILVAIKRAEHIPTEVATSSPLLPPARTESKPETFPHPPEPYNYSTFLYWLDEQDFQGSNFKLAPKRSWFDAQEAVDFKSTWFESQDMTAVLQAFEEVERWTFMQDIMQNAREENQAAVAPHLLTMRWFQDKLKKAGTVLDMGCGTGALLRYLQVFAQKLGNHELRAVGFDREFAVVQMANKFLKEEGRRVPGLRQPYLYTADMYNMKQVRAGLDNPKLINSHLYSNASLKSISNSTEAVDLNPVHRLDLVVVGAALAGKEVKENMTRDERVTHIFSQEPLKTIWLRVPIGGSMFLPVCKAIMKGGEACRADFIFVDKDGWGNPEILHGGTEDTEFEQGYRMASRPD